MSDDLPVPVELETPKPSRRRRIVKWAIGAVLLAAAFVALLPTILSTSLARTAIVSWLSDNVARKVDFAKLEVSWGHGVRLEGLKVADAATPGQPLLEAPLVEIDAPLLPLVLKKLRVRNFLIENPVVRIAQKTETETSASGAVKTRKVHRKPRPEAAEDKSAAPEPEEEDVLPEIHVPVEVRNLTIVYQDREGHEARRTGISFKGVLDTREGPTTFDLDVPDGDGAGLRVHGAAKLFASDGTMLGDDARTVDASVVITRVDAAKSRDFFALFIGDTQVAGVLDGTIDAHVAGADTKGRADLRLSHLGYGDAAKGATARQGDDLTVTGAFEWGDGKFRVVGGKVRAEGLVLDADVGGSMASMDGRATLDADLARLTGALRAIGVPFPGTLAGHLAGSMQFTPSPSGGSGDFTLTGFRADGLAEGRPPVAVETTRIRFAVVPSAERFDLTSFDVTLADLAAAAHGTRTKDGAIDVTAQAKGDLGGLLARVRDLGFLPGTFSVNGDLDAQVRVTGMPGALAVLVPHVVLSEKDARIEVSGTRAADGALDFRASGSGDLGSLFGRATADGPHGLPDVKGRFAFEATAKGPPGALEIDVPKLHVEGDLSLEAHGKLAANGAIDAAVEDLSGRVNDVVLLLRRTALLDRDVSLDGRLTATASVKGTREKPEIPHASLKLSDGPLTAEITGSVDAAGAVAAEATMSGDLAALAAAARRAGFDALKAPLTGRLTASAKAAGTRDKIAVPEFRVTVAGGAADVDVSGRYDAAGTITATASVSGELDRAVALARDQGFMKRAATTGCRYTLRAAVSGTPGEIEVPKAEFAMTGPLRLDVEGHANARRNFTVSGKLDGATQTLCELAAAWSGEDAKTVDGTVAATFAAEGRPDRYDVRIPALAVRARGLSIDADVARSADGSGRATAKVGGAIADILSLARAFGYGADDEATGDVDGDLSVTLAGAKVEASLALVATTLVVTKPKFGDGPFREPRLAISVPSAKYDQDTKALDVTKSTLQLEGAEVAATLRMKDGVASLEGTLSADERFSTNHAAQLSGAAFKKLAGPFSFQGDVSKGREKAAGWTGGFDLSAASVTAPHVTVEKASLPGKIEGGILTIAPISAVVNGGPVKGKATIGLVGKSPEHHLVLDGKNVELDADLAPLVARASPLFAIGEAGKTGGKGSIDLDLTANGYDSAAIKKSLKGGGTLGLADAYVESSREWVGELMKFLGSSERLTMPSVSIPFKVHDGKVETGEVPVEGAGLAMLLGGNAGLDGKLDYLMRVKTAGGGGALAKFESLLDKDGYLPLQLGGTIAKPKLKLPDWKDAAKGALDGLLGGKKKDDPPAPKTPPKKKKPAGETPPKQDEPPPPPPPGEEPPPPPPPEKKEEPPPPPPPK